jgi:hypothetical protein
MHENPVEQVTVEISSLSRLTEISLDLISFIQLYKETDQTITLKNTAFLRKEGLNCKFTLFINIILDF